MRHVMTNEAYLVITYVIAQSPRQNFMKQYSGISDQLLIAILQVSAPQFSRIEKFISNDHKFVDVRQFGAMPVEAKANGEYGGLIGMFDPVQPLFLNAGDYPTVFNQDTR